MNISKIKSSYSRYQRTLYRCHINNHDRNNAATGENLSFKEA